jgi:hypothetical protein
LFGRTAKCGLCKVNRQEAGKSRDTVERSVKRGKDIPDVGALAGTSLDRGVELDALAALRKEAPEEQQQLIDQAKAGEEVSAKEMRAQRKAQLASTSLGKHDELNALGKLPPRQRDDLMARAKAGEKVSTKFALEVEDFEYCVEIVVTSCTAREFKIPPGLPRERACQLLERVEEARAGLNALRNRLRAIVDGEQQQAKAKPDCPPCKGEGMVTVLLKNKEARISCDCKNSRPRAGRPGVKQESEKEPRSKRRKGGPKDIPVNVGVK